jgi:conjugal transfer/entry exclusion protein
MSRPRVPETPADLLADELAKEKASALGRMGRALEAAVAALAAFDAAHQGATLSTEQRQSRTALAAAAGVALWHFIVQREACGLRDMRYVLRDYRVPPEVAARMGVLPAEPVRKRRPG